MWQKMYIQSLMERKQWKRPQKNLEVGDLVLLVEKNQSQGQWITGRVTKTYPGTDNLVRVVDVETIDGVYRRAIHTLFPWFPGRRGEQLARRVACSGGICSGETQD